MPQEHVKDSEYMWVYNNILCQQKLKKVWSLLQSSELPVS